MNKLLLIAGGGVLLYWWYTRQPTAVNPTPQAPTTPPTTPPPQPGNVTVRPPITTPPVTPPPSQSLSQIYAALVADVQSEPLIAELLKNAHVTDKMAVTNASFDVLNWHLMHVTGFQNLPDYYGYTGQPDPGRALNIAEYWSAVSPWLKANKGLSGLGAYAPAYRPAYARSRYLGPGGWIA